MDAQKHVLLVTNATTDAEIDLIKNAFQQAKDHPFQIKLSLVHVIPNLPTCYFNIPSMVLLTERYYEEAKKCLTHIGDILGVHNQDQWLITGRFKTEVMRLAGKLSAHYILASSTTIQDLHHPAVRKEQDSTLIRSISNMNSLQL